MPDGTIRDSCGLHEAGHAVVAERLGLRVDYLEIISISSGAVEIDVEEADHERQAIVALAGLAAVEMFEGPVDSDTELQDDDCDRPKARRHAAALAGPDGDVDAVLAILRNRTDELLRVPGTEPLLRCIAEEAGRYRRLDGESVRSLIAAGS